VARKRNLSSGTGAPFIEPIRRDTADPKYAVSGIIPRSKVMVTINRSTIFGYKESR